VTRDEFIAYQGSLRQFRHRLPRRLSADDAAALRQLRGRLRGRHDGAAMLAMIPIENSIAGRVADIHHFLPNSGLHIVGEYFLPIHFQLMGRVAPRLAA